MKPFKPTQQHLDEISQSLFNKNYESLNREDRDTVFDQFVKERRV